MFQLGKLQLHEIEEGNNIQLEIFEKERLEEADKEEEQYAITVLEEKKAQMKPNMAAIAEYKKKVVDFGYFERLCYFAGNYYSSFHTIFETNNVFH